MMNRDLDHEALKEAVRLLDRFMDCGPDLDALRKLVPEVERFFRHYQDLMPDNDFVPDNIVNLVPWGRKPQ